MRLNPLPSIRAAVSAAWSMLRPDLDAGGSWHRVGINATGVKVTHETAVTVAAVWACMDVIASSMAASDWNVYGGIRGAANKESLPADALQYILNTRFNPEMTAQAGKRAVMLGALGSGNGYAEIEWDLAGRIRALWPLAPNRVDPRRAESDGRLIYRVTQTKQGGYVDIEAEDMFHIRGASLTGVCGDDTIAKAVQTIGMALAVDQFSASYFANGTQLGGVLKTPGKLDDAAYARLVSQFNAKHQGPRKSFKTGVLEGGVDFVPLDSNAQKAQLIEVRHQLVEEVCRWFRVPPHKIAHLLRSTNNNIEHQGLEFTRDTLRPWLQEIQQEADWKLVARGARKFVELDVDWAEQGDYKSRAEAHQIYRACGVFTVNDVLRKLGENTIGAEGDIRTMNGASVRLEDVGKNMLPAPPAPAHSDDPETASAATTDLIDRMRRRAPERHT